MCVQLQQQLGMRTNVGELLRLCGCQRMPQAGTMTVSLCMRASMLQGVAALSGK